MRDAFAGYDQWKTASPYDDCDDFEVDNPVPGFSVICPACDQHDHHSVAEFHHEELPTDEEFNFVPDIEEFWHCEECDWRQDVEPEDYENGMPERLKKQLRGLHERFRNASEESRKEPPKINKIEDFNFPEGDFRWESEEPGDWQVYHCGESDCPRGWHKVAYAWNFSREGDVLTIECMDFDEDGNWEYNEGWTSEEDTPWEESWAAREMATEMDDYFRGWAEYWLDCAETMKDPLGECMRPQELKTPEQWIEFCLDGAASNIRYLEKRKDAHLLPRYKNVEVEWVDEEEPDLFRLVFHGGSDPYYSEEYALEEGETTWEAASRIMHKFDWVGNNVPRSAEFYAEQKAK